MTEARDRLDRWLHKFDVGHAVDLPDRLDEVEAEAAQEAIQRAPQLVRCADHHTAIAWPFPMPKDGDGVRISDTPCCPVFTCWVKTN